MSEQPEVPELPKTPVIDTEAELLAGSEEDQQIGKEEPKPVIDAASLQLLQTQTLVDLTKAIQGMVMRQEATRQIPYNEIKPVTPFNPEGKRDRLKLTRNFFQCGVMVLPINLRESEIELINQLKPGRYIDRKVEVQVSRDGQTIHLLWPNKKIEQRMEFAARFPDITTLLKAIIAERKEKEARRRTGDTMDNEAL